MEKEFLRISDVADRLGISRSTAYDLVMRGSLPVVRLAGRGGRGILRVPADALKRLASDAMTEHAAAPEQRAAR